MTPKLEPMAKSGTTSPPWKPAVCYSSVNGEPYEYAGLSDGTLQPFSEKITYQLRSQGFNNILDLTDKYYDLYYIEDNIHFGTQGWLAVDKEVSQFMKKPIKTNYRIDNQKFFSK